MTEYCCEKFKENYEYDKIEKDIEPDTEQYNGKYATTCCCGSTTGGGIRIVREMEFCPFCGSKLKNEL